MKTTKSRELFGTDVATKTLRKKMVESIIGNLDRVMKAEECAETLYSAIDLLHSAYDN